MFLHEEEICDRQLGEKIFDETAKLQQTEQIFESDFWTEISAGEYNRLVQLLIEREVVWQDHIDIEIKTEGIKSLIGEFCNAGC